MKKYTRSKLIILLLSILILVLTFLFYDAAGNNLRFFIVLLLTLVALICINVEVWKMIPKNTPPAKGDKPKSTE